MVTHETTSPSVQSLSRRGRSRLWLVGILSGALLFLGLCAYLHADHRSDQWKHLNRILNITDPASLRSSLREGSVSQEDFPAALFNAIEADLPSCVENLLAVGVDLRVRDEQGRTPLQLAKGLGRTEITAMLERSSGQEEPGTTLF